MTNITNEDLLHAMETLRLFCDDHTECKGCPLSNRFCGCVFQLMLLDADDNGGSYAPCFWNIEQYCQQFLDPTYTSDW